MTQFDSSTAPTIGVYFFTNDLRIHDNALLHRAAEEVDQLLCVFCYPHFHYQQWWQESNWQQLTSLGQHRAQFLLESLTDLNESLDQLGQTLIVTDLAAAEFVEQVTSNAKISHVYRSQNAGIYEQREWQVLTNLPGLTCTQLATHTLFNQAQLPFELRDLPDSFSQFRKLVEAEITPLAPLSTLVKLPPAPLSQSQNSKSQFRKIKKIKARQAKTKNEPYHFMGGEQAAQQQLHSYFSGRLPLHYKEVRNAIYGWDTSTKFSPWLANGSLSVRTLFKRLSQFEQEVDRNSSTYWIYFELLWREYFQWYAHLHQAKLFSFRGIKRHNPLTSFYPERFKKWCAGNTPYPIVNACMRELNATGFMSNRGRQIVASCLVNELQLDWRYGAAYFEQQLIDYDVASNWGNWQYLAGVGADPRSKRHFNLEKQTEMFDPDGDYQRRWQVTQQPLPLDSVDAADWPIA